MHLQSLAKLEQEISEEEQRLQQLFAKEEVEKQQLELAGEKRERIIAALNLQLQSKAQELEGLQANEKQLQSLLIELQDVLADIPLDPAANTPFSSRKGKLPWPATGRISASFGSTREVGKLRWDGVLIEAPEGREVRSVHYGRVAFADWLRGFGLLLIIDHGDGYMSLYGYNQSLFKETGEWVEAGEVIAQVGSSGGRSSTGVYFGIRHNGEPVDPKGWCKQIKGRRISYRFPAAGPFSQPAPEGWPETVIASQYILLLKLPARGGCQRMDIRYRTDFATIPNRGRQLRILPGWLIDITVRMGRIARHACRKIIG